MPAIKKATIEYFRWEGSFLFFKIKKRCSECDMLYVILQRLMANVFKGKHVNLVIKPWLDNWWKIIWKRAFHAPILIINGHLFSQGIVPDTSSLISHVASILDDEELKERAKVYRLQSVKDEEDEKEEGKIVVYSSKTCPHCAQLTAYLEANKIIYTKKDITSNQVFLDELVERTGKMTIPVTIIKNEIVVGFDIERFRSLLHIETGSEHKGTTLYKEREPAVDISKLGEAISRAQAVLEKNRYRGSTKASRNLYPHQWNWDSGFISRGYLHYNPELAYSEMLSLFKGQWNDGFLPHIIFNPEHLDNFPGPEFWKSERSEHAAKELHTSGIGQPPVHASMIVAAHDLDPDMERSKSFLNKIFPRLKALHDFYYTHRDPNHEHLVSIVHPWESGLDNSPIWDEPLSRVKPKSKWALEMQRQHDRLAEQGKKPRRPYIEKYAFLVENLYCNAYNWEEIMKSHPFLVQDVLFNSVLCKSELDLGRIAEIIGLDPSTHYERAKLTAKAMNKKLFDQEAGLYYDFDLNTSAHVKRDTVFSYIPLYASVPGDREADRLLDNLKRHCFCIADRNCVGIPTYDMCQVDFNGKFYWRGPVWFNICWYLALGFRNYNRVEDAEWLEKSLLQLVVENGFYEYFEPETGKGLGADGFSWTAALFIDLAQRYLK